MQCEIETWNIDRFVPYARNPRKNDAAADRMAASITEFGFKIPMLARSNGEVVDGHLRLKAAQKLGLTEIPVVLCDEWSSAQVKAFRLLVNRSVAWAGWDEELLALELKDLGHLKFDLTVTGFDTHEIDGLLAVHDADGTANAVPPVPVVRASRASDLWLCGDHRVLCGDSTSKDDIARLLGDRLPLLMVTDPPYGIELDSEWREANTVNQGARQSQPPVSRRTQLHEAPDRRAHRDSNQRRHARRLVGSLRTGAQPSNRLRMARLEVHARSARWPLRIGFVHHQEGKTWTRVTTPGPEAEKPAAAMPGGRMGGDPDATWY